MELIVVDPNYEPYKAYPEAKYQDFISSLREAVNVISDEIEVEKADIGHGAELPAILITLGGLFFLGENINNNLESWIKIGKKFASLLKTISEKFGRYCIDEQGATLLAIQEIVDSEKNKIESIEKISENIIPISPFPKVPPNRLSHRPDSFYFQMYKVNKKIIYLFVIKSKGNIEIKHRIDTTLWMEF